MESRCAVRDFAVRRHLRLPRRITVTAGGGSSGAHRSVVVPFQRRCGWCRRRSRTGWHLYVGPTAWCFSMQQRVKPLRATASPSGVQYPLPNLELDLNLSGTAQLPVRSSAPAGRVCKLGRRRARLLPGLPHHGRARGHPAECDPRRACGRCWRRSLRRGGRHGRVDTHASSCPDATLLKM